MQPYYASASEVVMSGLLRADGILAPIGIYDNGTWTNTWPDAAGNDNLTTLDRIPKDWLRKKADIATTWYLIDKKNHKSVFHIVKPVKYYNHAEEKWGLLTDYKTSLFKTDNKTCEPKIGIACDTNTNFYGAVQQNSFETKKRILSFLKNNFNQIETEAIETQPKEKDKTKNAYSVDYEESLIQDSCFPIKAMVREKQNIVIERCYSIALPSEKLNLYYLEANRIYKNNRDSFCCKPASFFRAYILENKNEKLNLISSEVDLTDCDRKNTYYSLPFGIIATGKKFYLIKQNHYYESEDYYIYKFDTDRNLLIEVLKTEGGGV
jgi:hypothetical protein